MNFKIVWQEGVLLIILVVYIFYQVPLLLGFVQLPSPLYGGDYYYSHGAIQHFLSGGNPFKSSNVLGSEPGYLPLYTLLVGIPGIVFGLSAFTSMKLFSLLLTITSLIVFYLFANYLFKNKSVALVSLIFYLPLVWFPVWKYRQFTAVLILPLFFFAALYFYRERNYSGAIILGLSLGLMGISHTAAFLVALLFLLLLFFYMFFLAHFYKGFHKESFKLELKNNIKQLIIIGVIGIVIASFYWLKPIIVHHLVMPTSSLYALDFSSLQLQAKFVITTFKDYFLNFQSILFGIRSVLFILGIISLFFLKRVDKARKFLILILVTAFIGTFHQVLSEPLFGVSFSPILIGSFIFPFVVALLAGLSIELITTSLKKFKVPIIIIIFSVLMMFNVLSFNDYVINDRWIQAGKESLHPRQTDMQTWILENTNVNDVFISTNELNFAVNALTGRKQVNGRRAQNSPFLDTDKRQLDAAIILYGNNNGRRKELLEEYNVKYLYWDYTWIESEYRFNQEGKLVSWYDPLVVIDTVSNDKIVRDNGLNFFNEFTWIDPAVHEPLAKEKLIFILPFMFDFFHPWNPELDQYLTEVWSYSQENITVSRIYEVKI